MTEKFQYRPRPPSVELKLSPFIVSKRVQVNPDNSRAMSALTFFTIQIEYTANKNSQTLSQPKPWCNDSGVLNFHHGYYISNDVKEVVSSQPGVTGYKSTNQKIGICTVYES